MISRCVVRIYRKGKDIVDDDAWSKRGVHHIVIIALLHSYQAILSFFHPEATRATCLLGIRDFLRAAYIDNYHVMIGGFILAAAALAVAGAFGRIGWLRIWFFIPQFLITTMMAWGGVIATFHGAYLDGTKIPWPQISVDQIAYVGISIVYCRAMLYRCAEL